MPYRSCSGKITSYSCREGPKLEWSYITIRQELLSEMSKEWQNHENTLIMLMLKILPNHSKSLILGSRGYYSSNCTIFEKSNSNWLMLQAINLHILRNCPISALVKIFSFWHYRPLEHDYIDHSYHFWPHNPSIRLAAANQKNFKICWFTRKPLIIIKILKRCLLAAKKVIYKSSIDIASLSLILHVINGQFMFWPKNGQLLKWP